MKKCFCCGTSYPIENFHKKAASPDGLHTYCKPCTRAKNKKWVSENKERQKRACQVWYSNNKERASLGRIRWHYQAHYGISYQEFLDMAAKNNNRCKICDVELAFDTKKATNKAVLDHCHDSSKIRGVICTSCNKGLGDFRDNPKALQNAISYLKEQ